MNLTSDVELAERFGLELKKFHELRLRHRWPHVRLGRFDIRFTDAQIEQIVAQHSETPELSRTAGARTEPALALAGQTKRSSSRRRSSG